MIREPETILLRNGPLENLWGGGGGEVKKKKISARKNIPDMAKKKIIQGIL